MITKTETYFMGFHLMLDSGVFLKPKWYDLPRRFGLRNRYRHYTCPKGAVMIGNEGSPDCFMTVRDEDYNALINSNIPVPEPKHNLARFQGLRSVM